MGSSEPLFVIRRAEQRDLAQVCAIDHEAFSPYGTAESPETFQARFAAFPEGFIVAEDAETVIGYGTAEKWDHEQEPSMDQDPAMTHHPQGHIFCLTAMAVREAYRNKGVASQILQQLIKIAKEHQCERILLETTHAQAFYVKRGFRVAGERQQWGVPLAILQLDLP